MAFSRRRFFAGAPALALFPDAGAARAATIDVAARDSAALQYRSAAAGSVLRTVASKLGEQISLADYDSVASAIAAAANRTLWIPAGTYAITRNTRVPFSVSARAENGAVFDIASGVTLAFEGPFEGSRTRHFAGQGKVSFSNVHEVFPEWWTTNEAPGKTDMGPAINAALRTGKRVAVGTGPYRFDTPIVVNGGDSLAGLGRSATDFRCYVASGVAIRNPAGVLCDYPVVSGIGVTNYAGAADCFDFSHSRRGRFSDLVAVSFKGVAFKLAKTTLAIHNYYNELHHCFAFVCGTGLLLGRAGDPANANRITDFMASSVTTGIEAFASGCVIEAKISVAKDALRLKEGTDNDIVAYIEACGNEGTIEEGVYRNHLKLYADGAPAGLRDLDGRNKVVSSPNVYLPSEVFPGVFRDCRFFEFRGSRHPFATLSLPTNASAQVTISASGVVTGTSGGADLAVFQVTRINNLPAAVSGGGKSAAGAGCAITASVALGVVTFSLAGGGNVSKVNVNVEIVASGTTGNGAEAFPYYRRL